LAVTKTPPYPTATHDVIVGHFTPLMACVVGDVAIVQAVPPVVVTAMPPLEPTATHMLGLAQETSLSHSVVGAACAVHVPPPFAVSAVCPLYPPTATQVAAVAQEIASVEMPVGEFVQLVPPLIVT
jgi:hypothetical protein